jgi:hypothetical protein
MWLLAMLHTDMEDSAAMLNELILSGILIRKVKLKMHSILLSNS